MANTEKVYEVVLVVSLKANSEPGAVREVQTWLEDQQKAAGEISLFHDIRLAQGYEVKVL